MTIESEQRVFVALINDAGQILVAKRAAFVKNPFKLGLPGGHLNEGETTAQGAQREVHEEIGINIDFENVSFIKVRVDPKRTILFARMPASADCRFNLDPNEVAAVYWVTLRGLHQQVKEKEEFHKSLELALPILMDLTPLAIYSALSLGRRIPLYESAGE